MREPNATLRGGGLNHGWCVLVEGEGIRATREQSLCRLLGFVRIEPGVDPGHAQRRLFVDGSSAKRESVDIAFDLWDWEGRDVAELVRLGQRPGNHAVEVVHLVEVDHVGGHVRGAFETGGVRKDHVRVFFGGLERWVHVAEAGGEDDFCTVLDDLIEEWSCLTFRHVFNFDRFNIWQCFLEGNPALFVCVGPTEISGRSNVNERDFEFRVLRRNARDQADAGRGECGQSE